MWIQLAMWVATTLVTMALAPKPPRPKAAGLSDFQVPTAETGRSIPVLFGRGVLAGPNVVWYGDLRTKAIKKRSGFSKTTVGYRYYLGMHMVLCYSVDEVRAIRVADKKVWPIGRAWVSSRPAVGMEGMWAVASWAIADLEPTADSITETWTLTCIDGSISGQEIWSVVGSVSGVQGQARTGELYSNARIRFTVRGFGYYAGAKWVISVDGQSVATESTTVEIRADNIFGGSKREGGVAGTLDICFGEPTQGSNGYLRSQLGNAIPAYRDVLGLVARQMYVGTTPYLKNWSVEASRTQKLTSGAPQWYIEKASISGQANPAHIIRECMTNPEWGMGYPALDFDDASWRAAADQLHAEGFGLFMIWDTQATIEDFIGEVERHIDGKVVQDPATGLFSLRLLRDGAAPVLTLDPGNCKLSDYRRESWGETINEITVQWTDPSTGKTEVASAHDQANINIQGGRVISQTVQYLGCPTAELANRLAARDLSQLSRPKATAQVEVSRVAYGVRVGDTVVLNWPDLGITGMRMRVVDAAYGDMDNGRVRLSLLEDVFGQVHTLFAPPPPTGWQAPDQLARPVTVQALIETPYWTYYRDLLGGSAPSASTTGTIYAAGQPTGAADYTLQTRADGGAFVDADEGDFAPWAELAASVGPLDTTLTVSAADLDDVVLDTYATLGDELVAIRGVGTGTVTVDRGVLDTVPRSHLAGTRLICIESSYATDPVPRAVGQAIEARAVTASDSGELDPASAPIAYVELAGRQARPYPPGRVRINAMAYPASAATGAIVISWRHRDRRALEALVGSETNTSIGPEPGVTYAARLLDAITLTELDSESGISGETVTLTTTHVGRVIVEVWAEREGLESWQRWRHEVELV